MGFTTAITPMPWARVTVMSVRYDWLRDGHRGTRELSAVKCVFITDKDIKRIESDGALDAHWGHLKEQATSDLLRFADENGADSYMSSVMAADGFIEPAVVDSALFEEGEG